MADNGMGTLVAGAAVIAIAGAGYEYFKHSQASAGTGPTATGPVGYQPPSNLVSMLQARWIVAGKPVDQNGWVSTVSGAVPQASGTAWADVWKQWYAMYEQTGGWPSETQMEGWLKYAIDNGL